MAFTIKELETLTGIKHTIRIWEQRKSTEPAHILNKRIRIPNYYKAYIVVRAAVKKQVTFNLTA
jgi:hypothetical protein